ncbi:MAG: hypothetical protein ACYC4U_27365 [Pirellulaceae bacterium]
MAVNPYEPPKLQDRPKWRSRWKRVCVVSLCVALLLHGLSKAVTIWAGDFTNSDWFKIANGLLALGELIGWTMAGVGGIGWVISRRTPVTPRCLSRSRPDAQP